MNKEKLAAVYGTIPSPEEIDQLVAFCGDQYELTIITGQSIAEYLRTNSRSIGLRVLALPDHDENHTFLPGLEPALAGFHTIIIKERIGLYAYQAVKAKWLHRSRLIVLIDNLTPWPAQDIPRLRTIRDEVTKAADAFIVQSEAARDMLTMIEGIDSKRIYFVPPFVAHTQTPGGKAKADALKALGFHDGDFLVSVVGQVEWEEGLFDALHGIALARKENGGEYSKIKLAICGVGSFDLVLQERIDALGMATAVKIFQPNRTHHALIMDASSAIFSSIIQSRDRLEGDPFKVVTAIANRIPLLSGRTPMAEEFVGKYRLDFCLGSSLSISHAISRAFASKGLCADIATKAVQKSTRTLESSKEIFYSAIEGARRADSRPSDSVLVVQIEEIEQLVSKASYLDAIKLIDRVFSTYDLAVHHKSNLYRIIGDCFTKLGDMTSGKEAYETALSLDPYLASAVIGLGVISINLNKPDMAIIQFQKAVTCAPQDDMACLGLGLAFQGIGEISEANKWMERCLDLNPTNATGLYSLLKVAHQSKDFTLALPALERYLSLKPQDLSVKYSYAGALYAVSNFEKSMTVVEEILSINPTHSQALELKAAIQQKTNQAPHKVGKHA